MPKVVPKIVFVFFDLRKCDFDTYKGFCEKMENLPD
jgi:hypothetical protein